MNIALASRSRRTAPSCRRARRAARAEACVSAMRSRSRVQASQGPSQGSGTIPKKPVEAPSVAVPESIIPSADASGPKPARVSFQMLTSRAVRLPESFRGGCSFGAGNLCRSLPTRLTLTGRDKTRPHQGCQRSAAIINGGQLAKNAAGAPEFPSFRDAPPELGFTRVRHCHCPSRQQPTWMRRPGIQHHALFWIPGSLALLAPRNDGLD